MYSTYGEGYHNFHHIFPFDYSSSELDWRGNFNFSTFFIDAFARIGWAYDLRRASPTVIAKRIERTGDVSLHEEILQRKYQRSPLLTLLIATSHFTLPLMIRLLTKTYLDQ